MYGMFFCLLFFVLQFIATLINLVERLLLPFLYIHTCVIFNKCIQTIKQTYTSILANSFSGSQHFCISVLQALTSNTGRSYLNVEDKR